MPQSHATATLPRAPSLRGTIFHPVPLHNEQFSRAICKPARRGAALLRPTLAQLSIPCKHTGPHAWRQAAALKKLWNAQLRRKIKMPANRRQ
jgi:hypothetical protein